MDSDFAKINNLTEELVKYKEQFNSIEYQTTRPISINGYLSENYKRRCPRLAKLDNWRSVSNDRQSKLGTHRKRKWSDWIKNETFWLGK